MALVTTYTATSNFTLNNVPTPPPSGNDLATAAAALVPGSGATSYAAFNPAGLGLMADGRIFDWCTRWHWDSLNLKGYLMVKNARNPNPHKLFIYDAASSAFTMPYNDIYTAGGAAGSGHGFDVGAMDAATGEFYFLGLYAEQVAKWNGSGWTVATGTTVPGFSSDTSGPRGLSWHPNLYGTGAGGLLVNGLYGRIWKWAKSSGSSTAFSQVVQTPYSNVRYSSACYSSVLDGNIVSCGDAGLACYLVTPSGAEQIQDLPIPCHSNGTNGDASMARLMPTPTGSVCILESAASNARVWRLNTDSKQWELQPYTHPLRRAASGSSDGPAWPCMYVSTYGIYWALRMVNAGASTPDSLLWRPPSQL